MDAVEKQETQQPAPTLAKAQATNRQRINESLEGMVELPGGGWMIPAAPPAETTIAPDTCAAKAPDNQRQPKRPVQPPVCQPSENYPFRYVMKCDRPTPIPNPAGFGDPVGCSHCGAVFVEAAKGGHGHDFRFG